MEKQMSCEKSEEEEEEEDDEEEAEAAASGPEKNKKTDASPSATHNGCQTKAAEAKRRKKKEQRNKIKFDLKGRLEASGLLGPEEYLNGCNAHLVEGSQAASHAVYCDINSLYATSCKEKKNIR
jgi:hypothetical protein